MFLNRMVFKKILGQDLKKKKQRKKPFIKWVGGKTQLIEQLEALLPADFSERENVKYN